MRNSILRDPLDVVAEIALTEALGASRRAHADKSRITVVRPLPEFNEQAFEVARTEFSKRYAVSYGQALRTGSGDDEARDEALRDAQETLVAVYEELTHEPRPESVRVGDRRVTARLATYPPIAVTAEEDEAWAGWTASANGKSA